METKYLVSALLAAIPFVGKDAHSVLSGLAVSRSRVRGCDGKSVVHIWDKDVGDKDVGDVVSLDVRDAKMIATLARSTATRPPRRGRSKRELTWPALAICADGFSLGTKQFPYAHPKCTTFPDTDKALKVPTAQGPEHTFLAPDFAARIGPCMSAVGVTGFASAFGGPLDLCVFYGETETLRSLVGIMPRRREGSTFAEAMARRAEQIKPPAPPKTEIEILRDQVAELQARLGEKAA